MVALSVLGMVLALVVSHWRMCYLRGVPIWEARLCACASNRPAWSHLLAAGLGGIVLPTIVATFGHTPESLQVVALAFMLLFLSLTDLDDYLIPNGCVACIAAARLLYLGWQMNQGVIDAGTVGSYLASAVVVGVSLNATVLVSELTLGHAGLGGGDLKLYGACALYVGWERCLVLVMLSCLLGLASSAVLGRIVRTNDGRRTKAFPLGPSIALACLLVVLAGGVG